MGFCLCLCNHLALGATLTWVSRVPVVNLVPGVEREKWVRVGVMIRVRAKG